MKLTDRLRAWKSASVAMQYIEDTADAADIIDEMERALRRISNWIDREQVPYLIDSDDNPGQAVRAALTKLENLSR